jgi:hypothetical protein
MTYNPPAGPACANCGAPLLVGGRFCAVCGQAVPQAQSPISQPAWPSPDAAPIAAAPVWAPTDAPAGAQSLPAPQALPPAQTTFAAPAPAYWQQPVPYTPPAYGAPPAGFAARGASDSQAFPAAATSAYPAWSQAATPAGGSSLSIAIGLLVIGLALIVVACGLFVVAS